MKKWVRNILIVISIILIILIILVNNFKNNYKSEKIGNNKSIEEIEEYILNIKTYKANIEVTIKNNRNENTYKFTQEVTENYEKQKVIEPEEISGLEMSFMNGTLEIKNTKLNLSKIYENYPNLSENYLFLTDFIKKYQSIEQKDVKNDNGQIIMELKTNINKYNVTQKLYVNGNNLKPEKLEVFDDNNNTKVYILYNEIEINI